MRKRRPSSGSAITASRVKRAKSDPVETVVVVRDVLDGLEVEARAESRGHAREEVPRECRGDAARSLYAA